MSDDREDDRRLVMGLLAREPGAWERFIARYGPVLEASCRRVLLAARRPADPGSLADAVAEVHRALIEDDDRLLRAYLGQAPLGAYLHVVARTRTQNALRRREAPLAPKPAAGPDLPGQALEAAERATRLRAALSTLPSRDAEALRGFHLEGLDYPELARRLGVPEGQVGPLLLRARGKLRTALGENFLDRV